ncbi:C-type mannose receptor 2-like [Ruditapes philippinarum]|uniref:C-type mannose receptor 2-like n=1 Tax=Ruditapes philippinarum TaxID=129788 RepID=UPI00295A84E8|nr:C-type mannose receptor 2-like [Ruditapes philippinarum]
MLSFSTFLSCVFILGKVCLAAEKTFMAKWIQTDLEYPWNIYAVKIILGKGLDRCVENCKNTKECDYINFERIVNTCFLIGVNTSDGGTFDIAERIQTRKGYVFGNKQDWTLNINYETCSDCETKGCGPPAHKPNTVLNGNMWSFNNKIEYHCQAGFTDVSYSTGSVICQDNGIWSTTSIRCVPDVAVPNVFLDSFYFFDAGNRRTWQEGKTYCEGLGGHLADIKTDIEMEYITTLFGPYLDAWVWLGADDIAEEGKWVWSDGTAVDDGYIVWATGQPSINNAENCLITKTVFISTSRYRVWSGNSCDMQLRSICEF